MATRLLAAFTILAASCVLQAAAPAPSNPLVVHEWGTFTSVQGATGEQVWWTPLIKTDLPSFVYDRRVNSGGFKGVQLIGDKGGQALVRMETPVIYFYSDVERVVDVRVLFPQGIVTEWYPQATHVGPFYVRNAPSTPESNRSVIEWKGVTILPRETTEVAPAKLIRTRDDGHANHYYAARATDANLLRVASPRARNKGPEYERDLFYRGVGNFPGPLTATVDAGETLLTLTSAEPLGTMFVMSIRQGRMGYQRIDGLAASEHTTVALDGIQFAPLGAVRAKLMDDMARALTAEGLYPKEARAMVDTWQDQWFAEEGSRVLYLLPRAWTDRQLPLDVSPRPDKVVRVMVGRAELITPAKARDLKRQIMAFHAGDVEAQRHALEATRTLGLGRFLTPAISVALGKQPDEALWASAMRLANEASELESSVTTAALNH